MLCKSFHHFLYVAQSLPVLNHMKYFLSSPFRVSVVFWDAITSTAHLLPIQFAWLQSCVRRVRLYPSMGVVLLAKRICYGVS